MKVRNIIKVPENGSTLIPATAERLFVELMFNVVNICICFIHASLSCIGFNYKVLANEF